MLNSASRGAQVAKLKPFVPLFYGTLRLEGKVDGQGSLRTEGVVEDVPEVSGCALGSASLLLRFSSVLRHLRCAGMRRPCHDRGGGLGSDFTRSIPRSDDQARQNQWSFPLHHAIHPRDRSN